MTIDENAKTKLGRAKAQLILRQPFYATIMCGLEFIEKTDMPMKTLMTDGHRRLWYDPDWINDNDPAIVQFGIAHEVMHGVFKTCFHRKNRHPMVWNMAADYIINALLQDDGFRLWDKCLNDKDLVARAGGTTEGVYRLLMEQAEEKGGIGSLPDGEPFDDLQDPEGTPAEIAQAEAEMTVTIAQAAAAAKMAGKLSKSLEQFIDRALTPRVDWESALRRFLNARAKRDYSFARPKRRFVAQGMYLPSLGGYAMGEIVVAVDQSGSVSMEETQQFGAELWAQHQDCQPEKMHVMYFDSSIKRVDTFLPDDEVTIGRYACGGTAFSPIFKEIEERGIVPCCVVVLTDLECSDFGPEPDYPVLWVSTSADRAPFGEVIMMKQGGV